MRDDYIMQAAATLRKRHGTRNPFEIAEELGVHILLRPDFTKLKGMYAVIKRSRFIFINDNLSEELQRIICAHELGHDQLHRKLLSGKVIEELALFRTDTRRELEANIFAAALLIDPDALLELALQGNTLTEMACILNTDPNLIAILLDHLSRQGYAFRPAEHRSDFLKD